MLRTRFRMGVAIATLAVTTSQAVVIPAAQAANGKVQLDTALLVRVEGTKLQGYVPNQDKSGVTIVTGFDIGNQTVAGMKALGLPAATLAKLLPYVGITRPEANAYLKAHPLTITRAEAQTIDRIVQQSVLDNLIKEYNASSKVRFQDLPSAAQTVIYVVAHQYWSLRKNAPRFFAVATKQNWNGMVDELYDFGAKDQTRNDVLAEYVEAAIRSGALTGGGGTVVTPTPKPTAVAPTPGDPAVVPGVSATPTPGATPKPGATTTPGTTTPGTTTPGTVTPGATSPTALPTVTPPNLDFLKCE